MDGKRRPLVAAPSRLFGWLRLPRQPDPQAERHATWLELFFDLVFVVALSAVTARLPDDGVPTWRQLGATVGVFAVVQLAWIGHAFYDTRYDPDDVPHRLLVLLSVAGAGAIALGAEDLPAGEQLPVGYLVVRGALIVMYLRVFASDRSSRDLVAVYLPGFSASWLLWFSSLWLVPPDRPPLWIAALAIDLATPWMGRRWLRRHPVHPTHLPERMAQFTIIQIGATLASLTAAVPNVSPAGRTLGAAGLGLVVTASIWWVYTTFLTSRLAVPRLANGTGYAYVHIPIGVGTLFAGWALGRVVHVTDEGGPPVPSMLRLILAMSIIVWMFGGLGAWWFSVGRPTPQRAVASTLGMASVAAVGAFVTDPLLLLMLTALALAGYATLVTALIRGAVARLGPDRPDRTP